MLHGADLQACRQNSMHASVRFHLPSKLVNVACRRLIAGRPHFPPSLRIWIVWRLAEIALCRSNAALLFFSLILRMCF